MKKKKKIEKLNKEIDDKISYLKSKINESNLSDTEKTALLNKINIQEKEKNKKKSFND